MPFIGTKSSGERFGRFFWKINPLEFKFHIVLPKKETEKTMRNYWLSRQLLVKKSKTSIDTKLIPETMYDFLTAMINQVHIQHKNYLQSKIDLIVWKFIIYSQKS